MLQPTTVPDTPFAEQVRTSAGRRTLGLGLALLIEGLMLLLLLTLGPPKPPGVEKERPTVVTFTTEEVAEEVPEERPEPDQRAEERPATQQPQPEEPQPPRPPEPAPAPPLPAVVPTPFRLPPATSPPQRVTPPAPSPGRVYGPVDNRGPAYRDTERVGTAPNGEPLYAAEWYREPSDQMLGDYLSTARGPGWGLIACRTAPDYRVEDCVALGEYPQGSQITRSVLAAAWEFRVRPPRRGGQPLVGSWVRIRIDYDIRRR